MLSKKESKMSSKFRSLLSRYVGTAFAKQLAFADLLGERNWGVDISEGRAMFGDDLSYPIQLLGTEAEGDASWLWAWANEGSHLPSALLHACHQIRDFGIKEQIPELEHRSFPLCVASGHMISMVASEMNPDYCYYRGPYNGGALFFLVAELPQELLSPVATQRAITVLTEVISQFDVDHLEMAQSFLQSQGFTLQHNSHQLVARRSSDAISISFDARQRIDNIEGKLNSV